jgi:hypothetical protein
MNIYTASHGNTRFIIEAENEMMALEEVMSFTHIMDTSVWDIEKVFDGPLSDYTELIK